jgi:hypothetical protein
MMDSIGKPMTRPINFPKSARKDESLLEFKEFDCLKMAEPQRKTEELIAKNLDGMKALLLQLIRKNERDLMMSQEEQEFWDRMAAAMFKFWDVQDEGLARAKMIREI